MASTVLAPRGHLNLAAHETPLDDSSAKDNPAFVIHTKGRWRAMGRRLETLEYLYRKQDPATLLRFFQDLSEGLATAFADSARMVSASQKDRPGVYARGNFRRYLLDKAFRVAAERAGMVVTTGTNVPPTWSFPVTKVGAFSLTLGVVDRKFVRSSRRLRGRGQYVRDLAQRNGSLNPQSSLFDATRRDLPRIVPDGAFGALVVVEPSLHLPDAPLFIGFWVPSPSLRRVYLQCSMEQIIRELRDRVAEGKRPARLKIERKKPTLRRKPKGSGGT